MSRSKKAAVSCGGFIEWLYFLGGSLFPSGSIACSFSKKSIDSLSDGDYSAIRSVLTRTRSEAIVLTVVAASNEIEHFVHKCFAPSILNLELDIPVEIQYVVGNMFRFSLKRIGEEARREDEGTHSFPEKTF